MINCLSYMIIRWQWEGCTRRSQVWQAWAACTTPSTVVGWVRRTHVTSAVQVLAEALGAVFQWRYGCSSGWNGASRWALFCSFCHPPFRSVGEGSTSSLASSTPYSSSGCLGHQYGGRLIPLLIGGRGEELEATTLGKGGGHWLRGGCSQPPKRNNAGTFPSSRCFALKHQRPWGRSVRTHPASSVLAQWGHFFLSSMSGPHFCRKLFSRYQGNATFLRLRHNMCRL